MYFLVFLALWLILPTTGFWPLVKVGESWSNNSLYIEVQDKKSVSYETFLSAYAEEVSEWYIKSFVFGMLIVPFAVFVAGTNPLLSLVAFFLFQLAHLTLLIPKAYRAVEYVGKAANIAVRPRDTLGSAKRLQNFYTQFDGISLDEIQSGIEKAQPIGEFLVRILKRNIERNTKRA